MDPTVVKTLIQLGTYGPLGIMAAMGFWFFMQERKKTSELTAKLIEFAKASVVADGEHTKGWQALGNLYALGMESTKINTEMIKGLDSVKDAIERVTEEMRRLHDSKRG